MKIKKNKKLKNLLLIFFIFISITFFIFYEIKLNLNNKLFLHKLSLVKNFKDTIYFWHRKLDYKTNIKELFSVNPVSIKIVEINKKKDELYIQDLQIQTDLKNTPKTQLILVVRINHKAIKDFYKFDEKKLNTIFKIYTNYKNYFQKNGFNVKGLQLDADFPTSKLKKYSEMLKFFKSKLINDETLSITSLPTWFDSSFSDINKVLKYVNFHVIQFYSNKVHKKLDFSTMIFTDKALEKPIKKIQHYKCPYYFGISIFGGIHKFNKNKKFVRSYFKNINLKDFLNNRNFIFVKQKIMHPEKIVEFICVENTFVNNIRFKKNEIVLISIIDDKELLKLTKFIDNFTDKKMCIGIAWFRYIKNDENLGIPLDILKKIRNYQLEIFGGKIKL